MGYKEVLAMYLKLSNEDKRIFDDIYLGIKRAENKQSQFINNLK